MKRRQRIALRLLVSCTLLLALAACVLLPDFASQKSAGKYEPAASAQTPSDRAITPAAESQTEPHTCGLHAMRSLYAAYGLAPDAFNLRLRLGTDAPATRADKTTTGTLHPDLYRVLAQDGFTAKPIDPDAGSAEQTLLDHLNADQLALAVVYRGTYHWVLLSGAGEANRLIVTDSLVEEAIGTDAGSFLNEALSVTLVQPAGLDDQQADAIDAHGAGLLEMQRLYQRK